MSRNRKKTKSVKKKLKKYPKIDFITVYEESGLSLSQFAQKMGLSTDNRGNVSRLIYERDNPSWNTIKKFCEVMNCDLDDVIVRSA